MNNIILSLATTAAFFSGNLLAQEFALSNSQADASSYDCIRNVVDHDKTLGFQADVVTQEFTACVTGSLKSVELNIKNATEGATYLAELRDHSGDVMDVTRFSLSDVVDNVLKLGLKGSVNEGETYSLQITAPIRQPLALRYQEGPMGTLFVSGEPVRGQLAGKFGFVARTMTPDKESEDTDESGAEKSGVDQCRVAVSGHDGRVRLSATGHSATQTFTACADGKMTLFTVQVQSAFDDLKGRFFVKNEAGETLMARTFGARDVKNGMLHIPTDIRIENGQTLMVGLKSVNDSRLALHSNSRGDAGVCKVNGSTTDVNLEFAAYIEAKEDDSAHILDEETKVSTYPNPFADKITVRIDHSKSNKAIVQILDFSGAVLYSDIIVMEKSSGEVTFDTREIQRPGYYALRVIQGDDVSNHTIVKR